MSQAMGPASVFMQTMSTMFGAVSQAHQYKSAALMDEENARLDELQGALNVEDIRRQGRATQGEAIAALAAGGMGVESGSSRDLIYQNSLEIEYAAMNARYSAATEARGLRIRAKSERTAARTAIIGGIIGAGAQTIAGISNQMDSQRRADAYFPGGQRLPMPPPPPSSYTGFSSSRTPH